MSEYFLIERKECDHRGFNRLDNAIQFVANRCPACMIGNGFLVSHVPLLDVLKKVTWGEPLPGHDDVLRYRDFQNVRIED